jgi:hypothetical protein
MVASQFAVFSWQSPGQLRPGRQVRTRSARTFSVPTESRRLYFSVLTRFLDANRYPPRIKSGAGFRSKTLYFLSTVMMAKSPFENERE